MANSRTFTSKMVDGADKPFILVSKYTGDNSLIFDQRIRPAFGIVRAEVTASATDARTVELDMNRGGGVSSTDSFKQTVTFVAGSNFIDLHVESLPSGYWIKGISLANIGSGKTVNSLYAQIWCYEVEE